MQPTVVQGSHTQMHMLEAEVDMLRFGPKVQHNCCSVEHIPGLLYEAGSSKGIVAHQKDIVVVAHQKDIVARQKDIVAHLKL